MKREDLVVRLSNGTKRAKSSPWICGLPLVSRATRDILRKSLSDLWEPKIMTMPKAMVMCQIGHATFQAVLCSLQSEYPSKYQAGEKGREKEKRNVGALGSFRCGRSKSPRERATYRDNHVHRRRVCGRT